MKDVRVQPVSNTTATIQITCDCNNSRMHRVGEEKEFNHNITVGHHFHPKDREFDLQCECRRKFHIHIQNNHFHITEFLT